ncbi:urease accessory protein UreE [Echinicola strongylocentroti]|uniref:Urease accessory protein UreE n=1 Tax=Echinicola strongylocentroti TaxID=1795355 RepID=A0A2Z4ICW0_9BACT|nr:urease accessory protein UreE [Echinicola strongylocentroti]AWW28660.1 urease accessory protein UreE [Echinicola strongylocentroti]
MICKQIIGNVHDYDIGGKTIDELPLEWFETPKRIMRKRSRGDQEVVMKFLREGNRLQEGDIVYEDAHKVIVIAVNPCDAIEITPRSLYEMGTVCYEIGNKHLPLFIQDDKVLVPYEKPLERLLLATGYQVTKVHCKLLNMLKANVDHSHAKQGSSLFSKILDMASRE